MGKRKRQCFVAVVDDDAAVCAATANLLNSHGVATRGFSSAEQFLRARGGRNADCLILDLQLPGMSGLDLQRELRSRGLSIPVIFATAEDDPDGRLETKLLGAGAVAVLRKPFDPERLRQLVQAALEAHLQP